MSFGRVDRFANGLVELRFTEKLRLEEVAMTEVIEVQSSITPQAPTALLVDARNIVSMSRRAQEMAANNPVNDRTAGVAILVSNPVSTLLGNFFVRFARAPYEARVFRDEDKARFWLLERLEERKARPHD